MSRTDANPPGQGSPGPRADPTKDELAGLLELVRPVARRITERVREVLKRTGTDPQFPAGNLIEDKLRTSDLFGTYMTRIVLLRLPEAIGTGNQAHAEYWAKHWKVKFASEEERLKLIARFKDEADEVDKLIP